MVLKLHKSLILFNLLFVYQIGSYSPIFHLWDVLLWTNFPLSLILSFLGLLFKNTIFWWVNLLVSIFFENRLFIASLCAFFFYLLAYSSLYIKVLLKVGLSTLIMPFWHLVLWFLNLLLVNKKSSFHLLNFLLFVYTAIFSAFL